MRLRVETGGNAWPGASGTERLLLAPRRVGVLRRAALRRALLWRALLWRAALWRGLLRPTARRPELGALSTGVRERTCAGCERANSA